MNSGVFELQQELFSQYPYKMELHAHTSPCSSCSELPPENMIRLMKEQHYDAVVITNHFYANAPFMKTEDPVGTYLEDFEKTREKGEKAGIQVLLGAEYRFDENENDYLVYGVDESFLRETVNQLNMGIAAFYERYHQESLVILQAHPFRNGNVPALSQYLDGMETMNLHPYHNSRVAVATRYAREQGFSIVTVGTDLHHLGHEGLSALRTKVLPKDEAELVQLLRSGDYLFEIAGCLSLPF